MWIQALFLVGAIAAVPAGAIDHRAVRATLKSSERAIDDRIHKSVSQAPFVLLGATRGAYLEGYGAVFSLEVNLVPVANISPFRPAYTPEEIQSLNRQKREKLASLKTEVRRLMAERAAGLAQIPASEKIAVVVTLFNYPWEDTTGLPSQVVLQATRQALLDLHSRRPAPEALDRAIEVKEF